MTNPGSSEGKSVRGRSSQDQLQKVSHSAAWAGFSISAVALLSLCSELHGSVNEGKRMDWPHCFDKKNEMTGNPNPAQLNRRIISQTDSKNLGVLIYITCLFFFFFFFHRHVGCVRSRVGIGHRTR